MGTKQAGKVEVKRKGRGRPRGPQLPPPDAFGREVAATIAERGLLLHQAAALIGVSVCSLSLWLRFGVRTQYAIERLRGAGFIQ